MLKVKSRAELHAVTGQAPPPPVEPAGPDVAEVVAKAMQNMVEVMAQSMAQVAVMQAETATRIAADRPIRLEADIERDPKTQKMTKIVITPFR